MLACGGREHIVDVGTLIVLNAERAYRTRGVAGLGARGTSVAIRGDVLSAAMEHHGLRDPLHGSSPRFDLLIARSSGRLCLAERLLPRVWDPENLDALALEECAIEIAYLALGEIALRAKSHRRDVLDAGSHRAADAARSVLAQRFRERLLLSDIAAVVGLSPYHLAQVYRRVTGSSLHRSLNSIRLRAALDGVADGHDIARLAAEVGFSSHSHFSAAFRREFGMTPSAFREVASGGRLRSAARSLTGATARM